MMQANESSDLLDPSSGMFFTFVFHFEHNLEQSRSRSFEASQAFFHADGAGQLVSNLYHPRLRRQAVNLATHDPWLILPRWLQSFHEAKLYEAILLL